MDKLKYLNLSQKTRDIDPMLDQCWATVYDAGPILVQHWVDGPCLPGKGMDVPAHTRPKISTLYEHSENILLRLLQKIT